MKRAIKILSLASVLMVQTASAQNGPRYDSPETEELIEHMIEAHGGMEKWRSAPSLSYDHKMIDPSHPDDPWLSVEMVEQGRRRMYHEWPLDEALLPSAVDVNRSRADAKSAVLHAERRFH